MCAPALPALRSWVDGTAQQPQPFPALPGAARAPPVPHPMGRIMNSCMASALPAWLPPLMMLKEGTGSTCACGRGAKRMRALRCAPFPRAGRLTCAVSARGDQRACPLQSVVACMACSAAAVPHAAMCGWCDADRGATHQLLVAGQVGNVLVQGHALLSRAGLRRTCGCMREHAAEGAAAVPVRLRPALPQAATASPACFRPRPD
jgi:hypothetical protein